MRIFAKRNDVCIVGSRYDTEDVIPGVTHYGVGTASMIVRTKVAKQVRFDERLRNTGEDFDFCLRAQKIGKCKVYISEIKVHHLKRERCGIRKWLLFNFKVRGPDYILKFSQLPMFARARLIYWIFFLLSPISFLIMPPFYALAIVILYWLASHIINMLFQRKLKINSIIFNTLIGIFFGAGALIEVVRLFIDIVRRILLRKP